MTNDAPLPTTHERAIIDTELEWLARVTESVRRVARRRGFDIKDVYQQYRDVREGFIDAQEDELPAIIDQLHTIKALSAHTRNIELPNILDPYFAHMVLESGGKRRDVFLGRISFVDPDNAFSIIDWRNAPVARVFFGYQEGEEYEEELDRRVLSGRVVTRRILGIERGKLFSIMTPDGELRLNAADQWTRHVPRHFSLDGRDSERTIAAQSDTGAFDHRAPDVTALLDPVQFELLNAPEDEHLLILGGAGSGKTTVALHRLAALNFKDPKHFRPERMVVIVPETGLARLSAKILANLGLQRVSVATFDDWALREARHILKDRLPPISYGAPDHVVFIKRHPALGVALDTLIERQREGHITRLEKRFPHRRDTRALFDAKHRKPLGAQMENFEKHLLDDLLAEGNTVAHKAATKVMTREWRLFHDLVSDIRHLYSSHELLDIAARASNGTITPNMIDTLLKHNVLQASDSTMKTHAGTDPDALTSVDGRGIDDDTPESLSATIDTEDLPVLFDLLWRKTGEVRTPDGHMHRYSHAIIDEAQELAPLELKVLGRCLVGHSSISICGDSAQQLDTTACFAGWESMLGHLGVKVRRNTHLRTNYRCPGPVARFAHAVLGPAAPAEQPSPKREGAAVAHSVFANEGEQVVTLTETLARLTGADPRANVAIIARTPDGAAHFYDMVKHLPATRLVIEGDFPFGPGIDVTFVGQVKGLEFDYVVIPDADPYRYPDSPEARRHLHVAATRAIHQLWVCALGEASPLVLSSLPV